MNHSSDSERETSLAPLPFCHFLCAGERGELGEHSPLPDNLPEPLKAELQKGQDLISGDCADSHHSWHYRIRFSTQLMFNMVTLFEVYHSTLSTDKQVYTTKYTVIKKKNAQDNSQQRAS